MRCLHPVWRSYTDVMGVSHSYECPCGHCIACLHNQQDSWSIRLNETCFNYRGFVYDTLTIRPDALSFYNVTDRVLSLKPEQMTKDVCKLLDKYSVVDEQTGEYLALSPMFPKYEVQKWLKRGRENFFLEHHYRPRIKYFIVQELGPKFSRPHFHLLLFGLDRKDYVKFFAKTWRRDFGFTRTKYIEGGTDKDRECICRYISKYVSKGVFESPLVKVGLLPKPYRLISKGIGEEYLVNSDFDIFRSPIARVLVSVKADKTSLTGDIMRLSTIREFINCYGCSHIDFSKTGWRLTTYYDRNGFAHPLPRYFRHKLCHSSIPNVLHYEVQNYILACSQLYDNKKFQEFACSLGYKVNFDKVQDAYAGFSPKLWDLLMHQYAIDKRLKAKTEASRRFIKLKNHYGRAMNLQPCLQL